MTLSTAQPRRAFTLIELMVSIAMVLIIILGVNAIFKMASDTVNAGLALSGADRDNRAIQAVLYNDFRAAKLDSAPFFMIRSERVAAFRNAEDEQGDANGNPLDYNLDGNNTEGDSIGEVTAAPVYNTRNHRVDRVAFFASDLYRRQTGNVMGGSFLDSATSLEGYVWMGHLALPDFGAPGGMAHRNPNDPSVPDKARKAENYFATDWILGRSVTLLSHWSRQYASNPGNRPRQTFAGIGGTGVTLEPLAPRSLIYAANGSDTTHQYRSSVCDVADISIDAFRTRVQNYHAAWLGSSGSDPWWALMGNERFQGYPYPDKPLTPYGVARTAPVFVRGCTQFIVEFAGDYLAQRVDNGDVVGTCLDGPAGVDGLVDFHVVPDGSGFATRRIRWYGMPRNVDTSDDARGPAVVGGPGARGSHHNLRDVVPLRDVLTAAGKTIPTTPGGWFEKFNNLPESNDYAAPSGGMSLDSAAVQYTAAWGPNELAKGSIFRPKMIRITLTVDDPRGRMTEGQTYEYVIDLP